MYIVNYLSDVRMPRALYTLHVEVDVRSRRLWIILFATGLSTETLGFTSLDFRWDVRGRQNCYTFLYFFDLLV